MLANLKDTLMPTEKHMASGKIDDVFEENFMTAKFSVEIEKIVKDSNLNYIEAVVQFCEDKNIELDGVNKLISKPLKEKLKYEAQRLNFMKRTSKVYLNYEDCSISNLGIIEKKLSEDEMDYLWKCIDEKGNEYKSALVGHIENSYELGGADHFYGTTVAPMINEYQTKFSNLGEKILPHLDILMLCHSGG